MEATQIIPVQFTQSAIEEIKRLLEKENLGENTFLRVGVKGGGCSGLSYVLGFEEKTEKDTIYYIHGVPFIINPAHLLYLKNMEIDWEGGLNSRGFTFTNPNASENCGCGTSFSV